MESKEDKQLLDEIDYLTNLIRSGGRGQSSSRDTTKKVNNEKLATITPSSNAQNSANYKFSKKKKITKHSKKQLPIKSQLTWKRQILDDVVKRSPHTAQSSFTENRTTRTLDSVKQRFSSPVFTRQSSVATGSRMRTASGVSIYRWRKPSSGSKSAISPMAYKNKFKMTCASLCRKYNYIRHYPQHKSRQRRRSSRYLCYPTERNVYDDKKRNVSLKSHSKQFSSKSKNRVWVASDNETKNTTLNTRLSLSSPFCRTLVSKTRQGHQLLTANRNLQLAQQSLRKAALLSSAKRTSLVSLQRGKYMLDSSGKRLKRIDSTLLTTSPSHTVKYHVNMEASVKRVRANYVLEKSKRYAWNAKSKNRDKSKQYCIFFNRFGKCNKGEKCSYIHDPDKIAVCIKYLKGLCDKTDGSCLFSHIIRKEKMPVCSFFLRGICIRENCPYLHVSVGRDADICMDFVKGYCSKGEHCTKKHILDCPEFMDSGECPRGKLCPLRHRNRVFKSEIKSKSTGVCMKQPRAFGNIQRKLSRRRTSGENDGHDQGGTYSSHELNFIPLEINEAPDFIAL